MDKLTFKSLENQLGRYTVKLLNRMLHRFQRKTKRAHLLLNWPKIVQGCQETPLN